MIRSVLHGQELQLTSRAVLGTKKHKPIQPTMTKIDFRQQFGSPSESLEDAYLSTDKLDWCLCLYRPYLSTSDRSPELHQKLSKVLQLTMYRSQLWLCLSPRFIFKCYNSIFRFQYVTIRQAPSSWKTPHHALLHLTAIHNIHFRWNENFTSMNSATNSQNEPENDGS